MKSTVALNENYIFRRLYRSGACKVSPYLAVYTKKSKSPRNRLGITASKKIGGAVCRNRARRLIKEAYRLLEPELGVGNDIVIVARKKTVYAKMQDVQKSLRELFRQANVLM